MTKEPDERQKFILEWLDELSATVVDLAEHICDKQKQITFQTKEERAEFGILEDHLRMLEKFKYTGR